MHSTYLQVSMPTSGCFLHSCSSGITPALLYFTGAAFLSITTYFTSLLPPPSYSIGCLLPFYSTRLLLTYSCFKMLIPLYSSLLRCFNSPPTPRCDFSPLLSHQAASSLCIFPSFDFTLGCFLPTPAQLYCFLSTPTTLCCFLPTPTPVSCFLSTPTPLRCKLLPPHSKLQVASSQVLLY